MAERVRMQALPLGVRQDLAELFAGVGRVAKRAGRRREYRGPCDSAYRLHRGSISHFGPVIVRMLARDFVCGWTISPFPGTRMTVPSIAIVSATSSIRGQFNASSSPMRHPKTDKASTMLMRSYFRASSEPARNARIRSRLSSVSPTLGRGGATAPERDQLAHRVRLDRVMSLPCRWPDFPDKPIDDGHPEVAQPQAPTAGSRKPTPRVPVSDLRPQRPVGLLVELPEPQLGDHPEPGVAGDLAVEREPAAVAQHRPQQVLRRRPGRARPLHDPVIPS
jgi:hypothetical protein